jgi:hypothetical protein
LLEFTIIPLTLYIWDVINHTGILLNGFYGGVPVCWWGCYVVYMEIGGVCVCVCVCVCGIVNSGGVVVTSGGVSCTGI